MMDNEISPTTENPITEKTSLLRTPVRESSALIRVAVILVSLVIVFAVLDYAQNFFGPVLAAFVLGIVLSPVSRLWMRLNLRPALAALATLVIVLLALATIVLVLEPYVSQALDRAPMIWREFREAIEGARQMLQGLDEISKDVAASVDPETPREAASEGSMNMPSASDALFYAPQVLGQVMIFAGTLYFFLLVRVEVYSWIGASLKKLTEHDFEFAEQQVARYVLTITSVNLVFGCLVAGAMQLFGMPAPIFWGMLAFLLNFILYLGPIVMGFTLLVTGLVVFDGPISVAPAALYMCMNMMEGQFVTPAFVGQQMKVSPLLVFLSLVFWLWLWGPLGGIIALPLMIWMITIAEASLGQTISSGIPGKE
ncbi:MAG: AI-2E family transporter [Rhodobacteraceae bacterium]|nr:AI-2E family transporter [Paracoccaceae bacterium]